ncbi:hypothetical protein PsorP6_005600 [Peronosclerospora sorghi]|uniref:Uncharacterized protein n=1 Tax=Peronosclerospora sorghi TaxID=230839 RepID=A0ACC0W3L7_9STRA|nr:hypothetical protein PsorP6_005600 [Peronosclerospora sorghi]
MQETASYKNGITHGFTLDERGSKMSKSLGNTVVSNDFINGCILSVPMADTAEDIRLHWISQLQGDIPLEDVPGSVFLEEGWMPSAKEWENHDLARDWTAIRQLRFEVNRVSEKMRQAGRVGSQLECSVYVIASESDPRMQTLLFPQNRNFRMCLCVLAWKSSILKMI